MNGTSLRRLFARQLGVLSVTGMLRQLSYLLSISLSTERVSIRLRQLRLR